MKVPIILFTLGFATSVAAEPCQEAQHAADALVSQGLVAREAVERTASVLEAHVCVEVVEAEEEPERVLGIEFKNAPADSAGHKRLKKKR